MGLDVNTNVLANTVADNLTTNQTAMQNSLEKLSTGYAINKAADDSSGLVISQHLMAQIGGFQQAQANTQNAINVVQTADGALGEVSNILQRVRTLAVEAANTSVEDSSAQAAANQEATASLNAIDQIAQSTVYGSNSLLRNSGGTVSFTFQVGAGSAATDQVTFSIASVSAASLLGSTSFSLGGTAAIAAVDTAIGSVSTLRGSLGAYQNEFQHIANNESTMTQNLQASNAQIDDTNMASEMVNFTQKQVLVQAGVSLLSQANSTSQSVLKLLG